MAAAPSSSAETAAAAAPIATSAPRVADGSPPWTTRFAPSPTGFLHLGHVAAAIHVWGIGRRLGARILLRIEDHDRGRCRPEYEAAIWEDLAWLGFVHDNQEFVLGQPSVYRQSDQTAHYVEAVQTLARSAAVYACDCSRRRIAAEPRPAVWSDAAAHGDELFYAGHCRSRGLPLHQPECGWRVVLPDGPVRFDDRILGAQEQWPARQCGDMLLRDRHGSFTYQLAVVADDLRHNVNLVIRGQDLTASTGRQILLGHLLGRQDAASFAHHPLLYDQGGRKLGKRFFSAAVAKRRADGERAEDVLGDSASHIGLIAAPRPLTVAELPALFTEGQWPHG